MSKTFEFVSANGVPFLARLIEAGDGYGAWCKEEQVWALTHNSIEKNMIEFFDKRYPHSPFGQFTGGRYYIDTIVKAADSGNGLLLDGGVPQWTITNQDLKTVSLALAPGWVEVMTESKNTEFDSSISHNQQNVIELLKVCESLLNFLPTWRKNQLIEKMAAFQKLKPIEF